MSRMNRRRFLRGTLQGAAVSVALPFLDAFLDGNGKALASGESLPTRFGTWSWGLGMNRDVFVPKKTGANFDLPPEIASLAPVQKHINLFTNFDVFKDDAPNLCHHSGWVVLRSGTAPTSRPNRPGETIDVSIARKLGNETRFRSLSATATGDVRDSFSYEAGNSVNAPEWSPLRFYQRLFGSDFQNPNAETFTPDPRVMIRKSALSSVQEDAKKLNKSLGAEDRARLDQYFTGIRDLERRFDLQLTKPEPREACEIIDPPADMPSGLDADLVSKRHRIMTDLMLMAVACDQTRVFNMFYASAFSATTKPGYDKPHHTATHEEAVDEELRYQPNVSWYTRRAMEEWAYYVQALADFREGDGSLLDNSLIYATTDQSFAKMHAIDGIPMFTAGNAGGKIKTGLHIDGGGSPGCRLGYTAQRLMGLDIASWGTKSNTTSDAISEILV
ncbi:DUF1552 domain-containing protein [Congregibacter litoralis]|uniref:DUF1552 domain-containing protein n=1 Tax=Congregibacter litoralis KT71 TaxID=314285 RepID=A4ADK6_9GAMM|nr:DUF1552 domain-containing protein [Congregibacter litoralis]EAQ95895.2 hypothetical protein KT71_11615 [Congregibacter litoralis KT71]